MKKYSVLFTTVIFMSCSINYNYTDYRNENANPKNKFIGKWIVDTESYLNHMAEEMNMEIEENNPMIKAMLEMLQDMSLEFSDKYAIIYMEPARMETSENKSTWIFNETEIIISYNKESLESKFGKDIFSEEEWSEMLTTKLVYEFNPDGSMYIDYMGRGKIRFVKI